MDDQTQGATLGNSQADLLNQLDILFTSKLKKYEVTFFHKQKQLAQLQLAKIDSIAKQILTFLNVKASKNNISMDVKSCRL